MRIEAITAAPFPIPLIEPFVISRASVSSTRAVLVRATATRGQRRVTGYGEAALPLGSEQQPPELVAAIEAAAEALAGKQVSERVDDHVALSRAIDDAFTGTNPARSGLHAALLDAMAQLAGEPVYRFLGASTMIALTTAALVSVGATSENIFAASAEESGETSTTCSSSMCSLVRDVASTAREGAALSHRVTRPRAPRICSRLSRINSRSPDSASAASSPATTVSGSAPDSGTPNAAATATTNDSPLVAPAASTKVTGLSDESACARASAVLPIPPQPVSVTSR